jgi:hypothetical protein
MSVYKVVRHTCTVHAYLKESNMNIMNYSEARQNLAVEEIADQLRLV